MKKKNIINSILQNTRMPEGFFGRIILRGMNKGHASLSRWGLSQIEWKSDWTNDRTQSGTYKWCETQNCTYLDCTRGYGKVAGAFAETCADEGFLPR